MPTKFKVGDTVMITRGMEKGRLMDLMGEPKGISLDSVTEI